MLHRLCLVRLSLDKAISEERMEVGVLMARASLLKRFGEELVLLVGQATFL